MAGGIGNLATGTIEQVIGFGVGEALSTVLAPESTYLQQEAWSHNTILALDPQMAALCVRLGILDIPAGASHAAKYGVPLEDFRLMIKGSRTPPGFSELLELARRGELPQADLPMHFERAGIDERYVDHLARLIRVPLSPEDAAMARQQGFIDVKEHRDYAAEGGYTAHDADLHFEMAGLPPGLGQAMDLLRRGLIDEDRFAQMVREGHTKTKYTDNLLALRYEPLSAALAAEALVRERTTREHALSIAKANGMREEDFDLYTNMLARPMGIGQALTLVRRGQMDDKGFREVVARSDVRTEYTDDLLKLQVNYPPLFQLSRLITAGSIDDKYAREILIKEGYPEQLVDGIIKGAHKSKTKTTRHLSVGIIETLYQAGLETHAQAEVALENLGYTKEEGDELLTVSQARRIVSELTHGVTLIRSRYTGWKIDATTARDNLASLELDGETIDRLIKWWDAERSASAPRLTTAEIAAAFHYQRFKYDDAIQRLQRLGWSPDDALTILWNREHVDPRPGNQPPPATPPSG